VNKKHGDIQSLIIQQYQHKNFNPVVEPFIAFWAPRRILLFFLYQRHILSSEQLTKKKNSKQYGKMKD
jgi:hypothetical protein